MNRRSKKIKHLYFSVWFHEGIMIKPNKKTKPLRYILEMLTDKSVDWQNKGCFMWRFVFDAGTQPYHNYPLPV